MHCRKKGWEPLCSDLFHGQRKKVQDVFPSSWCGMERYVREYYEYVKDNRKYHYLEWLKAFEAIVPLEQGKEKESWKAYMSGWTNPFAVLITATGAALVSVSVTELGSFVVHGGCQ